jgi:protoheme IX farnesyltransferase
MTPDSVSADSTTTPRQAGLLADIATLAKLRVNALVVFTTAGGYVMAGSATDTALDLWHLAWTCIGTALVASGAAAVNQVHERRVDALMLRTRNRPVAAGRMSPAAGFGVAAILSTAGIVLLARTTNGVATAIAIATLVSYAAIYTPLKLRTSLSTMVGAVPGALPPLIGWAAVTGSARGIEPWSLFLIGFCWQLPHVLAVSWMYRDDYARAGFPLLPVIDKHGGPTGRQMVLWSASLVPVSVVPLVVQMTGVAYAVGALMLGLAQLGLAVGFLRRRTHADARRVFYASIIYLPLLWILMVLARR